MIPFIIIKKILLSLAPLVLFYLLRKMGNKQKPKRKSHLSEFDPSTPLRASKDKIVEGEVIDESSSIAVDIH